jgi:hypothetical protein
VAVDSSNEIDKLADQLLRKAGALRKFPTPIEDVVAAQRLTLSNPQCSPLAPGMLALAPPALQEKLAAVPFKVLAALDRRERVVHINPEIGNPNHERFSKLHEVGHDLCPWQDLPYALDGSVQLAPNTRELFEQEANYAAGRLLFQGDVFVEVARTFATGMASVLLLAEQFGGSIHAAFYEYVSTHLGRVGGYILQRSPLDDGPTGTYRFPISQELASKQFARTYGALQPRGQSLLSATHPSLKDAWDQLSSGRQVGLGEMCMQKPDGRAEMISFELFSNSYKLFLLLNADRRHPLARSVRLESGIDWTR